MATALCSKSAFTTSKVATARASRPAVARASVVVRAQKEEVSRRATLGALAGAAALLAGPISPSQAAFGDAANVFGKRTNSSGFVPYAGEGYALLLPSKWNPSREKDFPNIELRYEDNFDAVNNFVLIAEKTGKSSIEDFGDMQQFLADRSYLLGKQTFSGSTMSEGGFAPDRVAAASLLNLDTTTDKKGKKYYTYEILSRTADGDEGGRHKLLKATVGNGNLYILLVQVGDKRWFKGAKKEAEGVLNSFTVA